MKTKINIDRIDPEIFDDVIINSTGENGIVFAIDDNTGIMMVSLMNGTIKRYHMKDCKVIINFDLVDTDIN